MNNKSGSSKNKNHSHITSHITSNNSNTTRKKQAIGVAILDTGIYRHIDFENRIIAFVDFVNGQMMPYDDNGHGSHVWYLYTHLLLYNYWDEWMEYCNNNTKKFQKDNTRHL